MLMADDDCSALDVTPPLLAQRGDEWWGGIKGSVR